MRIEEIRSVASNSHERTGRTVEVSPEAQFLRLAVQGSRPGVVPQEKLLEASGAVRDWDMLLTLAGRHGLSAWLLSTASHCPELLPSSHLNSLRAEVSGSIVLTLALDQLLERVLLLFEEQEVPAFVLKGPSIGAAYYAERGLRPYSDMDVLVPLRCAIKVQEVLRDLGFEPIDDRPGFAERLPGTVEMPFETTYGQSGTILRLDVHYDHLQMGIKPNSLDGAWERSEPFSIGRASARSLGVTDLCLFLLVHLNKHGFERLIWFKDLDLILRTRQDDVDWPWLARTARSEGVLEAVRHGMRLLRQLFQTPISDAGMTALDLRSSNKLWSFLWGQEDILNLKARPFRWRRAVQFIPQEGLRGVAPSLILTGRRRDKLAVLFGRLLGRHRRHPSRGV